LPTVPFARETVPKLAHLQCQSPPGNIFLRAEVHRVPYSSQNLARQPSLGAALFPVAPHSLRITSCRGGWGGPLERYAYLELMETSEDPILATGQKSQAFKVGLCKFCTAKNALYKDWDSCAEHHICDCVRYPRWSESKFASNFSATICGVICGVFANYTNVEMPIRNAPRGRNLRMYGTAVEMLVEHPQQSNASDGDHCCLLSLLPIFTHCSLLLRIRRIQFESCMTIHTL
jgi:hypothetical protein